jgi:riboflavin kinase / FMN adenylyltransferase
LRVVAGSEALPGPLRHAVVTVGNFDGLHVGHREILRIVTERARLRSGESAVYTFEPHPRKVLRPGAAPKLLTTLEQKLELIEEAGVDVAVVERFDLEFARRSAIEFVRDVLYARLRPEEVYVGYDFRFGHDREGSMRTLTELGPHLGFAVTIVPEVTVGGRDVNSTRIRELLEAGQVEEARVLLGRPYRVRGRVVEGDRRGRTLGFPTVNLEAENEVLPAEGVYAGRLRVLRGAPAGADAELPAVVNVGRRPTFKGDAAPVLAEAHVIDWSGDLYGERVELGFVHRLREERRFPDVEALRRQIEADRDAARRRLAAR